MAKLTPIKNWNAWDEFGLLNGLGHWSADGKRLEYVRYPKETNKQLRERLKAAAKYRGNSTVQGMINNISRDLGISPSGASTLSWYNNETRSIYHLSEAPYPGPSGIQVYVSTSGSWTRSNLIEPQIRASGYADATSGWIVWNLPDHDPQYIPNGLPGSSGWYDAQGISGFSADVRYGAYTQILEFIGVSIPNTEDNVRVDYNVQTGKDSYGVPQINVRSDFGHPDDPEDLSFTGNKTSLPTASGDYRAWISGHVAIYGANDLLANDVVSGFYYDTNGRAKDKLIRLKKVIDDNYPLAWGKFRYDVGRWDQLERASIGNIPSFHDEGLPSGVAEITNGSRYGVDLDVVDIYLTASGAKDKWYPQFEPGEFYVGDARYHMFAKKSSENMTLTNIGNNIYSGAIAATGDNRPGEFEIVAANESGRYYIDTDLPNNPYINRIHEYSNAVSGVYYRTSYLNKGSGIIPAEIDYDDGYAFYYDYDAGDVYASGINPTGFILFWEHRSVATSGIYVLFSGGYGFTEPDLNPITDPHDKLFFLSDS